MKQGEKYAINVMETEIVNVRSLVPILNRMGDDSKYNFEFASSISIFRAYMRSFGRVIKKEILGELNNQMCDATASREYCPI